MVGILVWVWAWAWAWPRAVRAQGSCGLEKQRQHGTMLGLEPPALGVVESLLREREVGEVPERLADPLEPLLQARAKGAERR